MKRIILMLWLAFGVNPNFGFSQTLYLTPNPNDCVNCLVPLAMAKSISQDLHPTLLLPEMSQKDAKFLIKRQWKLDTNLVKYRVDDSLVKVLDPKGQSLVHLQDSDGRIWFQFPLKELSNEIERVNGFFRNAGSPQALSTIPDHINLPGYNDIIYGDGSLLFLNHPSSSIAFWNRKTDQWLQFHPDDWQFPHLDSVLQYFPPNQTERWGRLAYLASMNLPPLKYEQAHFDGSSIWIIAKYLTEQPQNQGNLQVRTDPVFMQYSEDGKFRAAHFVDHDSLREKGILLGQHHFWMRGKAAFLPVKQKGDVHIPFIHGKFVLSQNEWRSQEMASWNFPNSPDWDTTIYEIKKPFVGHEIIAFPRNNQIYDLEKFEFISLQIPDDLIIEQAQKAMEGYWIMLRDNSLLQKWSCLFSFEGIPLFIRAHSLPSNVKSLLTLQKDGSILLLNNEDQILLIPNSN